MKEHNCFLIFKATIVTFQIYNVFIQELVTTSISYMEPSIIIFFSVLFPGWILSFYLFILSLLSFFFIYVIMYSGFIEFLQKYSVQVLNFYYSV